MSLEELVIERSKKCELFSNPLRSLIAMLIAAKGEIGWSELKKSLEKWSGQLNPNTLSFHVGELMDAGFVDKVSIKGQPRYKIVKNKKLEIQRIVGKDLIKKIQKEFPT